MKRLLICIAAAALTSCSQAGIEKMEAERLAKMDLSDREAAVAAAFIEGFKKETGMPILKSRDYYRAACYAKTVEAPSRYDRVHRLYLADYTAIDKSYYEWFAGHGASESTAYGLWEKISAANEECKPANMLKKRFARQDDE